MSAAFPALEEQIEGLSLVDTEPRIPQPLTVVKPSSGGVTPMMLLQLAVQQGADMDRLERFMTMVREQKAEDARDAYTEAMAEFKRNPPKILKTKHVHFDGRNGGAKTDYWHSTHSDVTLPILTALAVHGFTHKWVPEQLDGYVHITCVITHRLGHSDHAHMFASPDSTGNKNGVQAICSTKTLLERYTLLAVTGLSTEDLPDDDGRGGTPPAPAPAPAANDDRGRQRERDTRDLHSSTRSTVSDAEVKTPENDPAFYSKAEFDAKSPDWTQRIKGGREAARLIPFIESRGKRFTAAQKQTLLSIKPV